MDEEITPQARELLIKRQSELIKLIDALIKLDKSKEWGVLKEQVFDRSLANIERQLLQESLAKEINTNKLYKLQGEWAWAKQHTDTDRFVDTLKKQLENIKNQLS